MNRLMSGNVRLEIGAGRRRRAAADDHAGPAAGRRRERREADRGRRIATSARSWPTRRLQQVMWNLVHNAIKFAAEAGPCGHPGAAEAERLQIVVKDNGQGISPAFLPHVFERFRQQDASSTRAAFGLGLGLSIAKQLVELHGGRSSPTAPATVRARRSSCAFPPFRALRFGRHNPDAGNVRRKDRAIRSASQLALPFRRGRLCRSFPRQRRPGLSWLRSGLTRSSECDSDIEGPRKASNRDPSLDGFWASSETGVNSNRRMAPRPRAYPPRRATADPGEWQPERACRSRSASTPRA